MGLQRGKQGWRKRRFAVAGLLFLLLVLSSGCICIKVEEGPLAGHRGARTILPAEKAWWIYVLPDGRRILYEMPSQGPGDPGRLMLLDVATGKEVLISKGMSWAEWLDDELLYGEGSSGSVRGPDYYYVVNLRPLSVVRLEALPGGAEALPRSIHEADSIYALVTDSENKKYRLLLLQRGPSGEVTQGYYAEDVRNLEVLLAGIPYRLAPPLVYNSVSPDGQYYYACRTRDTLEMRIYSQRGDLLNSVVPHSYTLTCYGWAWDSSGVYFQEDGGWSRRVGPLELLPVKP